jgi:AraC-like DNA-binding protein
MIFFFTQTIEWKYNSYLDCKHPDWPFLEADTPYTGDPLGIRAHVNLLTGLHIGIYMLFALRILLLESRKQGISLVRPGQTPFLNLRNVSLHFLIILIIFVVVKLSFPSDVGDSFISTYLSFMILTTGFKVMNNSSAYQQSASFLDFPLPKYKKSTLDEKKKDELIRSIEQIMSEDKYFLNHMASLGELSKLVKESKHHISQVINERLGMNFFELLAKYRVEEAKKILQENKQITIENLADDVGYNSKSAFNNAFKKHTGHTPTQFRDR